MVTYVRVVENLMLAFALGTFYFWARTLAWKASASHWHGAYQQKLEQNQKLTKQYHDLADAAQVEQCTHQACVRQLSDMLDDLGEGIDALEDVVEDIVIDVRRVKQESLYRTANLRDALREALHDAETLAESLCTSTQVHDEDGDPD